MARPSPGNTMVHVTLPRDLKSELEAQAAKAGPALSRRPTRAAAGTGAREGRDPWLTKATSSTSRTCSAWLRVRSGVSSGSRPRVKSSTKLSRSRVVLLKRAANESRHLRPGTRPRTSATRRSLTSSAFAASSRSDRAGRSNTRYSDHAVSGATLLRPGFQAMMREALRNKFDLVMAEALDRFSRDQEDTAGLFKRLTFAGVNIVTLAEGDITHLHIGLKGTMNALFLKELADKTRRGLRGRIELGKAGGGVSFGYRIVRRLENGIVTTGDREIVPEEASIVRRIFSDYRAGASPKQIAKALNAEGVRGPRGAVWSPSTIHGNPERGIGILHNGLYIGRLGVEPATVPEGSRHRQACRPGESAV